MEVLLVDDNELLLKTGHDMLESLGCRVTIADNGASALRIFEESRHGFDLFILDLNMPELDGFEVIKHIRTKQPHANIVVISGYIDNTARQKLGKANVMAIINKPYSLNKLASIIHTLPAPQKT